MSGRTTYTFAGVSFSRLVESDTLVPWLYPETQYTADPILGGTQVYLDIGGDTVATMSFQGSCASAANRVSLINARGTTGTLTNTRGHSDTVTLVKATPVNSNPALLYLIDLTFILRPS